MNSKKMIARLTLAGFMTSILNRVSLADAHAITVEGNAWVIIAVIVFVVVVIYFLIIGSMQAEERDGRLGRGRSGHEHGWFGMSGGKDDDDGGEGTNN